MRVGFEFVPILYHDVVPFFSLLFLFFTFSLHLSAEAGWLALCVRTQGWIMGKYGIYFVFFLMGAWGFWGPGSGLGLGWDGMDGNGVGGGD